MGLLILVVFTGVFAVATLLMMASKPDNSQKSTKVLDSLTANSATSGAKAADTVVDFRKDTSSSVVPLINRILVKLQLASLLRTTLYQANLKWTASGLLLMCLGCFSAPAYLVYLRTDAALFSLIVGIGIGAAPILFVFYKRSQRFAQFEQGLPEALDLMVSALRVGQSLNASLGLVSRECPDPVGTEFRICFDEQNYGLELRSAMDNMVTRVPLQDLRMIVIAILIQKESGGNLAEMLDKASGVIRERFRLKRQIRIHTAQGRLTGWVLTLLPVGLGVLLYVINPDQMSVLWKRDIGIKLLYTSGAMTVIGSLIIRKIVNMDV